MEKTSGLELWTESGRFVLEYARDIRVREVVNGEYYVSFDYLRLNDDSRYAMLKVGAVIRFPDGVARGQHFAVRKVTEIRNGPRIYKAVEAHHVAFGLRQYYYDGYIDFAAAKTLPEMLALLGAGTPFSFVVQGEFAAQDIYDWGEDTRYNLLQKLRQLYNAEIAHDNYEITLTLRKGTNYGTTLRYNQNLTGIQRTSHDMEQITRLYGYGKNGLTIEGLPGYSVKYIDSPYLDVNNVYAAKVDLADIEDKTKLLAEMRKYLAKYELPAVSYDVDFVQLEKVDRVYDTLKIVEAGDTITVYDAILGYAFDARAIEYEYYPFEPKRGRVVLSNFREMKTADYIFQATVGSKKAITYTSRNAVLKGITYDDSLTLVDGLGMRVSNPAGNELVRLGQYEPGKYGMALFNLAGVKTIWQDAATGDAYFSGTISGGSFIGGTITIGSGNNVFKADANGIYLGNTAFGSAPFRVSMGGVLTATNANITGAITGSSITGGTISGSAVSGGTITGTNIFGTNITGGTITGTLIQTSTDGQRIELSSSGNLLRAINGVGATFSILPNIVGTPGIQWNNGTDQAQIMLQPGVMSISTQGYPTHITLSAGRNITFNPGSGYSVVIPHFDRLYSTGNLQSLGDRISSMESRISALEMV